MKNNDNKQKIDKDEMEKVFKGMSLSKSEEEVIKGGYTIEVGTDSWICLGIGSCKEGCITACSERCLAGACYHSTSVFDGIGVVEG